MKTVIAAILVLMLAGCATIHELNDPARSRSGLDVANTLAARDIPYETEQKGDIAASYNLMAASGRGQGWLRLTLIFRNLGNAPIPLVPHITLEDATGLVFEPYSYEAYVRQASIMAGTRVPMIPATAPSTTYQSGMVTNTMTGASYSYYGTTTAAPNYGQSFAQGVNEGVAMASIANRRNGQLMLQWANSFWLKSRYDVPGGAAVAGALMYPPRPWSLPLKLVVDAGGQQFEFITATHVN